MLVNSKGLTLLEILFVLLISSILIYNIILYLYKPYKEASYLTVDAIPYLKECINEISNFCAIYPGTSFNSSMFTSCQPTRGIYGNITFEVPNATCTLDGQLPLGYEVKAFSTASDKFYAVCRYNKGGIKCFISPK